MPVYAEVFQVNIFLEVVPIRWHICNSLSPMHCRYWTVWHWLNLECANKFKEDKPVVLGLITRARLYQKNSQWRFWTVLQLTPEWHRGMSLTCGYTNDTKHTSCFELITGNQLHGAGSMTIWPKSSGMCAMIRTTSIHSLHSYLVLDLIYCRKKSKSIAGLTLYV